MKLYKKETSLCVIEIQQSLNTKLQFDKYTTNLITVKFLCYTVGP